MAARDGFCEPQIFEALSQIVKHDAIIRATTSDFLDQFCASRHPRMLKQVSAASQFAFGEWKRLRPLRLTDLLTKSQHCCCRRQGMEFRGSLWPCWLPV